MRSAAVLLTALFLLGASAAPGHLAAHDRRQLEQLAQHYLQRRADKVTAVPRTPGFGVPVTRALAAELRVDEAKLDRRRERHEKLPHGGYSRAKVTTELKRTTVDPDGSVVVHLHEVTDLYFAKSSTFDHTSYGMPHVLVFERGPAGWVLAAATRAPGSKCGLPPETQFCGHLSEG